MKLTVQDVARYFNVTDRMIFRWIDQKAIPYHEINGDYRFSKTELLEWATTQKQKLNIATEFFELSDDDAPVPSISALVAEGGIFQNVKGSDKKTVLRSVVDLMNLPEEVDRDLLYQILMARENMGSTGVGDGIAIPHVRTPVVFNVAVPMISLALPERPVDFGALDHKPVYCLFTLISPSPRIHIQLISRLAFILRSQPLKDGMRAKRPDDEIIRLLKESEKDIRPAK